MRLIGRGSLAGALVIVAVALVYLLALPYAARVASTPAPPLVITLGDDATVTAGPEWSQAPSELGVTTLTQAGATLQIVTPHDSEGGVVETIEALTESALEEAPAGSVATAPRTFETDAGDAAATVVVQKPLETVQTWVISNGELDVIAVLTAPTSAWAPVSTSAQSLLRTVTLGGAS